MQNERYTLISGPTASGKSSLALQIAERENGIIVNADALQVYKTYSILTARPSGSDLAQAEHALYGHRDNVAGYSVGSWLREIENLMNQTERHLIIVGGTGLYFKALLEGLSGFPAIDPELRVGLELRLQSEGLAPLVQELRAFDPKIAETIDLQNPRRVVRALEVYLGTGKPLSQWQAETPLPLVNAARKILVIPEVETTNRNIETRFDQMLEQGAIDEVRSELDHWQDDSPANQALGAKEIADYLRGQITLEDARALGITATRQYAKRQRTWFRARMKDWDINFSE